MRLWKSCLRDRTRKGKYFSRKGIKALWPQPKNDEMEGVRVVYDHPPRRPRLPETLSVNRNNGPEDTFSIFPCCHCSVKSLSDVVTCHTEVCTSKEERHKVRMDLPAPMRWVDNGASLPTWVPARDFIISENYQKDVKIYTFGWFKNLRVSH